MRSADQRESDLRVPGHFLKQVLHKIKNLFKGTVWHDCISLRVVSLDRPLKGHQPLYVFDF